MEEGDIIVRRYIDSDYGDLIDAGYPFDSYLRPNLYNKLKNLINRKEIGKILLKRLLLNREEIILVAYSKKDRKPVGVITLRKITESLWGIWHTFVSPLSRGKRIASLLYQQSFKLLKDKKVEKVVTTVGLNNVASVKSIQRNWQGFLSTAIFLCQKKSPVDEDELSKKIEFRKPHNEKRNLFETFRDCVGEQWCKFLEIDIDNFLDRIFGSFFESIDENFLTRSMIKKNVLVSEYEGKIQGYAISRMTRFFHAYHALYLFVPVSDNFDDVCIRLLSKVSNLSVRNNKRPFEFIYIGKVEAENRLRKLGFKVKQLIVPYKYL